MIEIGTDLTDFEYVECNKRWIDRATANVAGLRHVDTLAGKELVGGRGAADYSGTWMHYFLPGRPEEPVTGRLRRANPEIDARSGKPSRRYLSPPGERNHLYFPRWATPEMLADINLKIIWTEGELKTVALWRLANFRKGVPEFLPIGVSGVNNYRGIIGTTTNEFGARVAVRGEIPDLDRLYYHGRQQIIAFDSDLVDKKSVRAARWAFNVLLRERGSEVGYLEWDPEFGKGIDDWLAKVGPEAVLEAIAKVQFDNGTGWKARLYCSDTGKPKALGVNVQLALANAPEFAGLCLDEFSGKVVKPPTVPWWDRSKTPDWTDRDTLEFTYWLQAHGVEVGKEVVYDAVDTVAGRNKFHPIRDHLNNLNWDGEPRVDTWLSTYVGVKADSYTSAAGRCWLISAVARIFQPGCKADVALILIGPEGLKKSSVCRLLGEPWFSDNLPDLADKDAQLHLLGRWIIELQELAALNKTALNHVKAYMSRNEDIYRPPYGRLVVQHARQCVFIATTNEYEPLKDTTGNRRFWPVEVGNIDLDALCADRDQLWAEAVAMYRDKVPWWFREETLVLAAREQQEQRVDVHIWYDRIRNWAKDRPMVTVAEVLDGCILKTAKDQTQADKVNVVRCLQAMSWTQARRRLQGVQTRVYLNPDYLVVDEK